MPFGFHRHARIMPRVEAAFEGPDILVTALLKFLHQTGAGGFVGSCAIRDHRPALGYPLKIFFEVVQRHTNRFWDDYV